MVEAAPHDFMLKAYKNTIEQEVAVAEAVEEAGKRALEHDYDGAIQVLEKVPADSAQAKAVEKLVAYIQAWKREHKLDQVREAFSSKNYLDARALAEKMPELYPDDVEIKSMVQTIQRFTSTLTDQHKEAATADPPTSHALLKGAALAAYLNMEVDKATVLEEASGEAGPALEKLRLLRKLDEEARDTEAMPEEVQEAIKLLGKLRKLDSELGGGLGKMERKLRNRLSRSYSRKATQAVYRKAFEPAFASYREAIDVPPASLDVLQQTYEQQDELRKTVCRFLQGGDPNPFLIPDKAPGACREASKIVRLLHDECDIYRICKEHLTKPKEAQGAPEPAP
jgi:tetratricopeptide (TPR) repeat protein